MVVALADVALVHDVVALNLLQVAQDEVLGVDALQLVLAVDEHLVVLQADLVGNCLMDKFVEGSHFEDFANFFHLGGVVTQVPSDLLK